MQFYFGLRNFLKDYSTNRRTSAIQVVVKGDTANSGK